jgi:hypothetical protein
MFTMKFLAALCSIVAVSAVDIAPGSAMGKNLISKARLLNNDQNQYQYDVSWLTSYSIKFQGCHSIKQWNSAAEGDEDVKIATKSLVRFRMCPTDGCSANKGGGCQSGYGEYVVDLVDFMASWYEASRQDIEYTCWEFLQNSCNCNPENNQADDFNEEYCEYDCFNNANMPQCIDRNPYEEENQERKFNVEEYVGECKQFKAQNRRLNDNNNNKYYVGPYCSGQGGDIYLGFFSDDSCSIPVEDVTFADVAGYELPYSTQSLVGATCVTCLEHAQEDNKNQQEGGEADADAVSEACENLYIEAGKCEANLPEGITTPNNNACSYMEGIKIVREDGMIVTLKSAKANKVATTFIVIFAVAFAGTFLYNHYFFHFVFVRVHPSLCMFTFSLISSGLAFYVHYLRTRLGTKENTLLK